MKRLLLLRHAKSSWSKPYLSDHDRPLNERGKRDGPLMGTLIRREDMIPELIITSSAKRALKTAEAVAESAGYDGEIVVTRSLYHADTDSTIHLLNGLDPNFNRIMLVGHNPWLEELLEVLTSVYERIVTAMLVEIHLPVESWKQLDDTVQGKLVSTWRPKDLVQ